MKMTDLINVYMGTYTHTGSKGIYLSRLDCQSGTLSEAVLVAELSSPGFLALDSARGVLYSTGDPDGSCRSCSAAGFNVLDNGQLEAVNRVAVKGLKMCHVSIAADGKALFGADYGHAKAAVFPISSDGVIAEPAVVLEYASANGANPARQSDPHVHSINPDISGRYIFVCDFSADAVRVYEFSADSKELSLRGSCSVARGSGPRHLICHPDGSRIYVINELSGTIDYLNFSDGVLTPVQVVSTLPPGFDGVNTAAEIRLSPDSRFLYASNRGDDSIAYYRVNPQTGCLDLNGIVSSEGEHPRNFTIDSSGRFMLVSNRDSGNIAVFRIENETGRPVYTGSQIKILMPMCIVTA